MRHPIRALVIGVLAVGLAASGCQKNTGDTADNEAAGKVKKVILDVKGEAKTPAAEVEGATKGGTINVLADADFEHLGNPQAIYVSNALTTSTQLIHRTLTQYIESPTGGDMQLVGDLATNSGETTDNGKTWKYTLRDGIAFEDGTPITSKDIAYGVARSFSDEAGADGPQYIQNFLQPDRTYKGPYNGGADLPPGVTTPDDKTIVFTFTESHADFPLLAAMPTTSPVPKAKDTKAAYETAWVSSGPYKLKAGSYKKDQSMVLVKNDKWKAESDPIRHQYVDEWHYAFDVSDVTQTQRVLADSGDDQTAIQMSNIPVALVSQAVNNESAKTRSIMGRTPFVRYIAINTQKVTDVDVRRALNYAFDRESYLKTIGGRLAGEYASTILGPDLPGYKKYNAYPAPPAGDVDKAKELLKGKTVEPLNYCFGNRPSGQKVAAGIKIGLERAGFKIVLQPVDPASYYKTIGDKNTTCHLMTAGWGPDAQDAITVIPPLFDGKTIRPTGNQNYSYFNEPSINAEMDKLAKEVDRAKAAVAYGELDEKIMKDYAPIIPTIYDKQFSINGSKVGGGYLTPLYGQTSFVNLYVKK